MIISVPCYPRVRKLPLAPFQLLPKSSECVTVSAKEARVGRIEDIYISLTVLKGLLLLPYHAPVMLFLTGSVSRSRLPLLKMCIF